MSSRNPVTALRSAGGTSYIVSPSCTRSHSAEPFRSAGRKTALCPPQWNSPPGRRSSRQGVDWMHGVKTCRTGLIPTASSASWSVRRMLRKPSPVRALSRKRFWLTVSSTDIGSGSRDLTRRPRTMSCTCLPSSP